MCDKYFITNTNHMLLIIGIILIVLWLLGFTVFHVTERFIHIVLVVAIIMIAIWLIGKI